jgi:hypothetical protein
MSVDLHYPGGSAHGLIHELRLSTDVAWNCLFVNPIVVRGVGNGSLRAHELELT